MTISELNEAVRVMKTIYSFQDHITGIEMLENLKSGLPMVSLTTIDQVTGAEVVITKTISHDAE